jgi:hypothetical protein
MCYAIYHYPLIYFLPVNSLNPFVAALFSLLLFCFIQNMFTWSTIGLGKEKDGLFYLQHNSGNPSFFNSAFSAISIKAPSTEIWHYRLGHPSQPRLALLQSLIPSVSLHSNNICIVCPMAKQRKLSFPVSHTCTESLFDIIRYDIWGPFSVNSINGSRFFSYNC